MEKQSDKNEIPAIESTKQIEKALTKKINFTKKEDKMLEEHINLPLLVDKSRNTLLANLKTSPLNSTYQIRTEQTKLNDDLRKYFNEEEKKWEYFAKQHAEQEKEENQRKEELSTIKAQELQECLLQQIKSKAQEKLSEDREKRRMQREDLQKQRKEFINMKKYENQAKNLTAGELQHKLKSGPINKNLKEKNKEKMDAEYSQVLNVIRDYQDYRNCRIPQQKNEKDKKVIFNKTSYLIGRKQNDQEKKKERETEPKQQSDECKKEQYQEWTRKLQETRNVKAELKRFEMASRLKQQEALKKEDSIVKNEKKCKNGKPYTGLYQQIEEKRKYIDKLKKEASKDPLTDIYQLTDKRYFEYAEEMAHKGFNQDLILKQAIDHYRKTNFLPPLKKL